MVIKFCVQMYSVYYSAHKKIQNGMEQSMYMSPFSAGYKLIPTYSQ